MSGPESEAPRSAAAGSLPCPRCGEPVDCGMRDGRKACWCFKLPHALAVSAGKTASDACLCETCLRKSIAEAAADSAPEPGHDPG